MRSPPLNPDGAAAGTRTLALALLAAVLLGGCASPRASAAAKHKQATAAAEPASPPPPPPPLMFQGEAPPAGGAERAASPLSAEELAADEANVAGYALNLRVGMTLDQARAVFRGHPLKLESEAKGANGGISVYRTLMVSEHPEVWLTFYSDSLQSWTTVAKH